MTNDLNWTNHDVEFFSILHSQITREDRMRREEFMMSKGYDLDELAWTYTWENGFHLVVLTIREQIQLAFARGDITTA